MEQQHHLDPASRSLTSVFVDDVDDDVDDDSLRPRNLQLAYVRESEREREREMFS